MGRLKKRIPVQLFLILSILMLSISYSVQAEEVKEVKTEIISNFEVIDADIRDVFRSLAELGGINILMDPQVKGDVSIKLKHGLTVTDAIELLSQTYGYSFRWITETRTVIVGNEKTFANFESRETKIYHLNYAVPDQVKSALKTIIAEDRIGMDLRTNQLTIRASILEHQNIAEIVARLDREMPQINIDARMEELSKTASKELGLLWSFGSISSNANFKVTSTAAIQAVEERNEARLLANPNISVTDSQEGKILIGKKFPIISSSSTDKGIEYTIDYIEYGTKLTVTPRINEDDIITVTVKAEVSDIAEWKKTGEGDDVPVIKTREVSSVIRLREGETFVLSGLHQENTAINEKGLPGLSRVPLVGSLFGNKKKGPNEQTEVVIFLTPKIIRFKNDKIDNSNVLTIGKQPATEIEPSKPVTESIPATQIIDTPAVQEVTPEKNAGDSTKILDDTPGNVTAATDESLKPSDTTISMQEGSADKEIPVEEKEFPDLSKLPKPDSAAMETKQPALDPVLATPADVVRVKLKIKAGETLTSIAKKHGINKESIITENELKPGMGILAVGTELILPIPKNHFYEIKPKETLWRIAKRYGSTVEQLMEINNITDHTKVGKGQSIILPVAVDKVVNNKF